MNGGIGYVHGTVISKSSPYHNSDTIPSSGNSDPVTEWMLHLGITFPNKTNDTGRYKTVNRESDGVASTHNSGDDTNYDDDFEIGLLNRLAYRLRFSASFAFLSLDTVSSRLAHVSLKHTPCSR